MSAEHPFAPYIRILGKGPNLSRPLTQEEARAAVTLILDGAIEPVQLGAFLCLLRVKTETPAEVAGFAQAIRDAVTLPPDFPAVDLDWPSYAGKSRHLPLFLLSALLLARAGIRVALHGAEGHTAGRLYSRTVLEMLGVPTVTSLSGAAEALRHHNITYVPLEVLHPRLGAIIELKPLLGVRSPLHTVIRSTNPLRARLSMISVFHPNYRAVHQAAAALLGDGDMICLKGEGGEIERRADKLVQVDGQRNGMAFSDDWPALTDVIPAQSEALDPDRLLALWEGRVQDPAAELIITATAALPLFYLGRAETQAAALTLAEKLWRER